VPAPKYHAKGKYDAPTRHFILAPGQQVVSDHRFETFLTKEVAMA